MKKKIIISILILSALALYYLWPSSTTTPNITAKEAVVIDTPLSTPEISTGTPTTQEASVAQSTCSALLENQAGPYALAQVKANPSLSERFHNRHLEYQGEIYRLRSFYDDANEGEQLTFLVYLEDEDEFAHIKERSALVKGQKFLELEELLKNGEAQLIYDEIGVTIEEQNHKNEIFLRYLDGKLNTIQGRIGGRHLECLGE